MMCEYVHCQQQSRTAAAASCVAKYIIGNNGQATNMNVLYFQSSLVLAIPDLQQSLQMMNFMNLKTTNKIKA